MGKLFIAEEDTRYSRGYCELACCSGVACGFYMHSAASKVPTSLRKRPGFSRSVSFRFSFSSATSFSFFFHSTAPRVTSQWQELSDFLGYEYAAGGCKRLGAMVLVMRWMGKGGGVAQAKKNVRHSKKLSNAISTCEANKTIMY